MSPAIELDREQERSETGRREEIKMRSGDSLNLQLAEGPPLRAEPASRAVSLKPTDHPNKNTEADGITIARMPVILRYIAERSLKGQGDSWPAQCYAWPWRGLERLQSKTRVLRDIEIVSDNNEQ